MKKTDLQELDHDALLDHVEQLQLKLMMKNQQLQTARVRLTKAKNAVERLQDIVTYQRERILELYQEQVPATRDVIRSYRHD